MRVLSTVRYSKILTVIQDFNGTFSIVQSILKKIAKVDFEYIFRSRSKVTVKFDDRLYDSS